MNKGLKIARYRSNLTQADVAKRAGISYRAYQDYEAARRTPSVIAAQSIAAVLGSEIGTLWPIQSLLTQGRGLK